MKVLVFAHQLELGGTQTNAIELTAALRDAHGFEVVLFVTPGPMVEVDRQLGLRYLPAPDPLIHPSPGRMLALAVAVRREQPDLIRVWDWWQCIDVYFGEHLLRGIPMVVTDMNMTLTSMLPKTPLTTFGLPELVSQARAAGWREAELLLPPVDVRLNAPGAVDSSAFRERCGIKEGDLVIVTVSRLAPFLKGESLRRMIAAVRILGRELPVRLILVGDGVARAELEQLAVQVNLELARPAIMLAEPMQDPRPAYQAADIVVGMGGSALRGMAFGKPVVIVREQGFSNVLSEETADWFYTNGIFGLGDGDPDNSGLVSRLRRLAESASQRSVLGGFARQFVIRHFSVETVSARLAGYCRKAVLQKTALFFGNIAPYKGVEYLAEAMGKLVARDRSYRRTAVGHLQCELEMSQRRACNVVRQPRATQRHTAEPGAEEERLRERLNECSRQRPRAGYRTACGQLRQEGLCVNVKRVQRLWREEGLKVPRKQCKQRRLGTSENGSQRRVASRPNEGWSYDFVSDQTSDGQRLKFLCVVDEFTRECLALEVGRSFRAKDVIEVLAGLVARRGAPAPLRSDNGPEFVALAVQARLQAKAIGALYIAPGSPWENAYVESFNSRLRDEHLNREEFASLLEAQVLAAGWRRD